MCVTATHLDFCQLLHSLRLLPPTASRGGKALAGPAAPRRGAARLGISNMSLSIYTTCYTVCIATHMLTSPACASCRPNKAPAAATREPTAAAFWNRTARNLKHESILSILYLYAIQYVEPHICLRLQPTPLAAQSLPRRRRGNRPLLSRGTARLGISNISLSYLSYIYILYSMCSHTYTHVSSLRLLPPKYSRGGDAGTDRC